MILELFKKQSKRAAMMARIQCDECKKTYDDYACRTKNKKFHFCSLECINKSQSKGGALRESIRLTSVDRYGTDVPSQSKKVREKTRKTNNERFGTDWASQSQSVQDKQIATNQKRFGVDWPIALPEKQAKGHLPEARIKAHETKKRNGSFKHTKPENEMYELLCREFGVDNVEREVLVNVHWPIDFYVKNIDTYIQYDCAYWHGLDRPIDQIRELRSKQDSVILLKIDIDKRQTEWFAQQNMRLVRITEYEFSDKDLVLRKINL